jgi:hypothetical protein
MSNLHRQVTQENAISKLDVESPPIADHQLAATIRAAEQQRTPSSGGAFLADGLADAISKAREESLQAKANRDKSMNFPPNFQVGVKELIIYLLFRITSTSNATTTSNSNASSWRFSRVRSSTTIINSSNWSSPTTSFTY